ncbi:NUDIX domain-containing protein [Paenibacillus thermotolerans]|uniref:NUDIX domain-containing protein n=1 Tax=Paenibacillus thermotolerans TaxID=3027807 RepID=UPI0023678577|nr:MULTISPECIES: NUDIX domain-containing protein [unclassified Paenibacillus]
MTVVNVKENMEWLPMPNEIRSVITNELPPPELVTSAFVLAFKENALIVTNLNDRGWDIPGGHIEAGETPVQAVMRELYEETGAVIEEPEFLGFMKIHLLGERPPGYKYPFPCSYMVFYCANIAKLDPFESTEEVKERGLFGPEKIQSIPWVRDNFAFYEEAFRRVSRESR